MANVLIVDDSLMMRKFISLALSEEGYVVSEAAGGKEALELVNSKPPDCMVLDLLMPDMVGMDVLTALKKENQVEFPIIIMTADVQESTQTTCLELGAYSVLLKPPKGEELCNTVREAMAANGG
jgi:DNA-binding response OmpR family regulator